MMSLLGKWRWEMSELKWMEVGDFLVEGEGVGNFERGLDMLHL